MNTHRKHFPALATAFLLAAGLALLPQGARAQTTGAAAKAQSYVGRYDLYAGYVHFDSPHIGLNEDGFHIQAGMNPRRWLSAGFDYSSANGQLQLTPNLLPTALATEVDGALAQLMAAGVIPSTYMLSVPTDSYTQTFAAGPQLMYRHFSKATLFLRPSLGAIRERATPKPTNAVALLFTQQLAPAGYKVDWTGFYGVGGGADFTVTKHFGLRAQADFVHDHLFNDLLKDGRNTIRLSFGPSFHFGRNVTK